MQIRFQPPTGNPYSMEVFPIETHLLKVIDIHDILTEKKEFKTNEYLPIETLKRLMNYHDMKTSSTIIILKNH